MVLLAVFLVVHGGIHVIGAAKAFGWAEVPQLTESISPSFGAFWLLATFLFLLTAGSLFVWPRGWWAIGLCSVVMSMMAIVPSWNDAKAGTLVNIVVLAAVAFGRVRHWPE